MMNLYLKNYQSKVQLKFLCLLGQGAICGGYFYKLSDNKKCLSGVFEPQKPSRMVILMPS